MSVDPKKPVDPKKTALLLIEYQNDFVSPGGAFHGLPRAELRGLTPAALQALNRYSFPGNVRELENMMKRIVVLGSEDLILKEIQDGKFARQWIAENKTGMKKYNKLMKADLNHKIEKVGVKLREDGSEKWLSTMFIFGGIECR